ncbi:MAG: recombinase family protein [Spirochaetales bacterium]|nr:recombinase family protein [Spirochaetales bacterium]
MHAAAQLRPVCLKTEIDTTSPFSNLVVRILMVFAEFERDMTADRIRRNAYERSKRGTHTVVLNRWDTNAIPNTRAGSRSIPKKQSWSGHFPDLSAQVLPSGNAES